MAQVLRGRKAIAGLAGAGIVALSLLVPTYAQDVAPPLNSVTPAQEAPVDQPAAAPEQAAPAAAAPSAPATPATAPASEPAATPPVTGVGTPADPAPAAVAPSAQPAPAIGQPAAPAATTQPPVTPVTPAAAAPADGVDLPAIETGLEGHDMSPYGMFMAADYVVKSVMLGLLAAAVITWIILLAKWLQLSGARSRARKALREVVNAPDLAAAAAAMAPRRGMGALLVKAADEEFKASADMLGQLSPEGVKERISSRLNRIEVAAGRKMSRGLGILASIGSVGPFVGLFGTVWGIMNSFIGIAEAQTTNLAVVAPGIAEALLATAFGLVAAIPAVIIYNASARSVTGYRQLLTDVSAAIERLASRDLDRLALKTLSPRALAAE